MVRFGPLTPSPPPLGVVLHEELESVQKRAARFVTGNYNYKTGSMTGVLGQLKWESLKKRRKDNRLILLYKGLKGKASVPTDDLIPKTRRCRNQHSMAFQTPIANTDVYKGSFFPQTISKCRKQTFKINLEVQNYVHFEEILSRNVKIFGIMASI